VGLTNLGSESETCVGSRVRLVGVFISFEKNFYRLPFTPPPLWFAVSVLHPGKHVSGTLSNPNVSRVTVFSEFPNNGIQEPRVLKFDASALDPTRGNGVVQKTRTRLWQYSPQGSNYTSRLNLQLFSPENQNDCVHQKKERMIT
jgi:hypothetical protein